MLGGESYRLRHKLNNQGVHSKRGAKLLSIDNTTITRADSLKKVALTSPVTSSPRCICATQKK